METNDLHPSRINIYGWVVMIKRTEDSQWFAGYSDADHPGLPEHHEFLETAQATVEHLRKHGVTARIAGLLQEDRDNEPKEADNEQTSEE